MSPEDLIAKAIVHHQNNELDRAYLAYSSLIEQYPKHFQALNLIALVCEQLGQDLEAIRHYASALQVNRNYAPTHFSLGTVHLKLGQLDHSIEHLTHSLLLDPSQHLTYTNLGIALHKSHQTQLAHVNYIRSLQIKEDAAPTHFNLACLLQSSSDPSQERLAQHSFERCISLKPEDDTAYNNLGNLLSSVGNLNAAVQSFHRSIWLKPSAAHAHFNLGTTLFRAGKFEQSAHVLSRALSLAPQIYGHWNNFGNALKELGQYPRSLQAYERALILAQGDEIKEALYNQGIVQHEMGMFEMAKVSYDKVLILDPCFAKAINARALTHKHLNQFDQAIEDFQRLIHVEPEFEFALGNLLHTQMHVADWSLWTQLIDGNNNLKECKPKVTPLRDAIEQGRCASHPFPVLALYDDPWLHQKCSQLWFKNKHSTTADHLDKRPWTISPKPTHQRIRVAYLSADFHNHATSYLVCELFELHDKARFEIFALSLGPTTNDFMQLRIKNAVEHFVDVSSMSDLSVANYCRAHQIDIAVDLKGYTLDSRFNIFVHRCARHQISYLGYPGTSGAPCIDFLIADEVCIPKEYASAYLEKIIYLPNSYQVNDRKRSIQLCNKDKSDHGLPSKAFVFCCFNSPYKITPPVFSVWMDILASVDHSVLWLLQDSERVTHNLRREATKRGVSAQRLIFAPRLPLADHLGRHVHADLFLDTLPYNAHTTASDALWAGLPVLTQTGQSFASRVAASLLSSLGLHELITSNSLDFKQKAIDLALNKNKLQEIKVKLQKAKYEGALFDSQQFTMDFEDALIRIDASSPSEI